MWSCRRPQSVCILTMSRTMTETHTQLHPFGEVLGNNGKGNGKSNGSKAVRPKVSGPRTMARGSSGSGGFSDKSCWGRARQDLRDTAIKTMWSTPWLLSTCALLARGRREEAPLTNVEFLSSLSAECQEMLGDCSASPRNVFGSWGWIWDADMRNIDSTVHRMVRSAMEHCRPADAFLAHSDPAGGESLGGAKVGLFLHQLAPPAVRTSVEAVVVKT